VRRPSKRFMSVLQIRAARVSGSVIPSEARNPDVKVRGPEASGFLASLGMTALSGRVENGIPPTPNQPPRDHSALGCDDLALSQQRTQPLAVRSDWR
jgi:hypothetical protein